MKKILFITVVVMALMLTACNGSVKKVDDSTLPNTQPTPNSAGNEEPTIGVPGVEDSIFDDPDTPTLPAQSVTVPGTEPAETDPVETEPSETEPQETKPNTPDELDHIIDSGDEPERPEGPDLTMTYEQFQNLSPTEMRLFEESFESKEAFFAWYNAARDAYNEANPPIEVGPGGAVVLPND